MKGSQGLNVNRSVKYKVVITTVDRCSLLFRSIHIFKLLSSLFCVTFGPDVHLLLIQIYYYKDDRTTGYIIHSHTIYTAFISKYSPNKKKAPRKSCIRILLLLFYCICLILRNLIHLKSNLIYLYVCDHNLNSPDNF
jgi:hypothetical protein